MRGDPNIVFGYLPVGAAIVGDEVDILLYRALYDDVITRVRVSGTLWRAERPSRERVRFQVLNRTTGHDRMQGWPGTLTIGSTVGWP